MVASPQYRHIAVEFPFRSLVVLVRLLALDGWLGLTVADFIVLESSCILQASSAIVGSLLRSRPSS